jgi:hypothetical protein
MDGFERTRSAVRTHWKDRGNGKTETSTTAFMMELEAVRRLRVGAIVVPRNGVFTKFDAPILLAR